MKKKTTRSNDRLAIKRQLIAYLNEVEYLRMLDLSYYVYIGGMNNVNN